MTDPNPWYKKNLFYPSRDRHKPSQGTLHLKYSPWGEGWLFIKQSEVCEMNYKVLPSVRHCYFLSFAIFHQKKIREKENGHYKR